MTTPSHILENPFTPSFGEKPAYLAGRHRILADLETAYQSERRRPALTALLLGARGTGKTTLLALAADAARARGWVAVRTTAVDGMLNDLEIQTRRQASHLVEVPSGTHISGVGIPQIIELKLESSPEPKTNWRSRMEDLIAQLEQRGSGLLIEVDEVHSAIPELRELVAVYQNFVSDDRRVGLLMAGLPHHVAAITEDRVISFLRRAKTYRLGRIDDGEIADAIVKTVESGGRTVDPALLGPALSAIDGFPFMLQLVGFEAWEANPASPSLSGPDIELGVARGREEIEARIFEPTYRELSPGDLRFLAAMLEDEGDTRVADLAVRLERSSSQVAQYRRRLIDAGIIGERGRGVVGFDLPFFREFLEERL
jgi:hypothetical protein